MRFPWRYVSIIAAVMAASLVVAACGGGGEGDLADREIGDELERALQSVTENDLAIMVLPQEELGEEFADLEIDEDSGFQNNEQATDDTINPEDTGEDLERAGRINGYELEYVAPDLLSMLEAGEGVAVVETMVHLFKDAGAASDFLAEQVEDYQRFEGKEVMPSMTLQEAQTFAVDGLADEAIGVRARVSFGDMQLYGTGVYFRLGRLVGEAWIATGDDADVNSQVKTIARALEERIEGVLLGDITGTPMPLPQVEEEATVAPPPEGAPDLPAMALSLDDLPAGVSIDHEGYVEDEDTVASYEREFDLGSVSIGSSRPISLESEVDLYENATEASGRLAAFELIATSESGVDLLAPVVSERVGFRATDVRLEPLPTSGLGEDSVGFRVSFDSPLGRLEMTFIFVRVDRAVGSVSLMGLGGKVDSTDAISLAEAMAARMAAEGARVATASPTAGAPASLTPTREGAVSEPSCQLPADITSYRYIMEMSMEAPELMEELSEDLEGAAEG